MTKPQIIGVSGTFGSGKDLLSQILVDEFGYTHVSTSDLVREVAMQKYGSIERPVLRKTAEECRKEFGAGYFVDLGLDRPKPLVISGIRSLGEMKAVKKAGGIMVSVDAPIELRFERIISRMRDDESKITLEEFRERESKELYSGPDDSDFNIAGIKQQADFVFINDSTVDEFKIKAFQALGL